MSKPKSLHVFLDEDTHNRFKIASGEESMSRMTKRLILDFLRGRSIPPKPPSPEVPDFVDDFEIVEEMTAQPSTTIPEFVDGDDPLPGDAPNFRQEVVDMQILHLVKGWMDEVRSEIKSLREEKEPKTDPVNPLWPFPPGHARGIPFAYQDPLWWRTSEPRNSAEFGLINYLKDCDVKAAAGEPLPAPFFGEGESLESAHNNLRAMLEGASGPAHPPQDDDEARRQSQEDYMAEAFEGVDGVPGVESDITGVYITHPTEEGWCPDATYNPVNDFMWTEEEKRRVGWIP